MTKRRQFTKEFENEAVRLAETSGIINGVKVYQLGFGSDGLSPA